MKKILSLQTLVEKEHTELHAASAISLMCKKHSSISLFWCVWQPKKDS